MLDTYNLQWHTQWYLPFTTCVNDHTTSTAITSEMWTGHHQSAILLIDSFIILINLTSLIYNIWSRLTSPNFLINSAYSSFASLNHRQLYIVCQCMYTVYGLLTIKLQFSRLRGQYILPRHILPHSYCSPQYTYKSILVSHLCETAYCYSHFCEVYCHLWEILLQSFQRYFSQSSLGNTGVSHAEIV